MGSFAAVSRWVRRNRRLVAALCAGLAVLGLGMTLRPAPARVAAVVVADRNLPTGHRLAAGDVRVADVAAEFVPPGAGNDPQHVEGMVLAAPVARGEPLTGLRLVAGQPGGWATPPGTSAVPVRFADPGAAALLSPGIRVDLLSTRTPGLDEMAAWAPARLVAESVLVLAVTRDPDPGGVLLAGPDPTGAPLVVLAATRSQALAIAGAQAGALSYALATGAG